MKHSRPDEYDLELERVSQIIKESKAKLVCIQLPDGLKPKAAEIVNHLKTATNTEIIIWLGSCFGNCDIPNFSGEHSILDSTDSIKPNLIIQWGHDEL